MSFWRTFRDELAHGLAADTESPQIRRIRLNAAGLSMGLGVVGLVLILPMARGVVSWAAAPGGLALIAGGILGALGMRNDVRTARLRGLWALVCTAAGFAEVMAVLALT